MITKPRPGHDRHPEGVAGHHLNRTACTQAAVQADRSCISRAVSGFSAALTADAGGRLPQPADRGTPVLQNAVARSQTAVTAHALNAGDHEQIVPTDCRLPAEW
jgi:hypothetical protein